MPPTPQPPHQPRIVLYHQTHYHLNTFISALPLLTEPTSHIGLTHLIIAALHLNALPDPITLNDDPVLCAKHAPLWEEVRIFQSVGVKVLGMLGGAAKGTFARLDAGTEEEFEAHYVPLREVVRETGLDGLDLDVEEEVSLRGVVRLIDRLKGDFGKGFEITVAPVANAMVGGRHLSGFDYEALEVMRGALIGAYHVQFYNGWGSVTDGGLVGEVMGRGWRHEKVVLGLLTHPGNGEGFVGWEEVGRVLRWVREVWPRFGGVMGWEYFNCVVEGREGRPWEWAEGMRRFVRDCEEVE